MKRTRYWILGCLLLLTGASLASAQQLVPMQGDGAVGGFSIAPMVGADGANAPMFANNVSPFGLNANGTVGGRGAGSVGNLSIGFDYIRPFWSTRDFILAAPAANAGNFPLLGDTGHVDEHFALAPTVRYKYD